MPRAALNVRGNVLTCSFPNLALTAVGLTIKIPWGMALHPEPRSPTYGRGRCLSPVIERRLVDWWLVVLSNQRQ